MATVTVIIPVFQVEHYLPRCVESILKQTFSDWDLILIDDGSSDRSPSLCDNYVDDDIRVHVIHQTNTGPSAARNRGIDWAFSSSDSEYLTFVDADDLLHPEFLERMLTGLKACGADVIMCDHSYIREEGALSFSTYQEAAKALLISPEELLLKKTSGFNYIWGKIYKKECFKKVRYPEDIYFGEDNLVIYKLLFESGRTAFLDEKDYYYCFNPMGVTKSRWTDKSLDVFKGINDQLAYYSANGYEKAYAKTEELFIQQCAYQIHRIREDTEHYKENVIHLKELRKWMKQKWKVRILGFWDNYYWYEALFPYKAGLIQFLSRVKKNMHHLRLVKDKK